MAATYDERNEDASGQRELACMVGRNGDRPHQQSGNRADTDAGQERRADTNTDLPHHPHVPDDIVPRCGQKSRVDVFLCEAFGDAFVGVARVSSPERGRAPRR